jgi:hypothetical protein
MSDLILIWVYILTPLALFLIAYTIEAYASFKRLIGTKSNQQYLEATWEITHTFLVVSVALFVGFFSSNLREIAYVTFFPLFLTSVFVGIRTLAYIYIFLIRSPKKQQSRSWIDWVFAWSHIGVIIGLAYLLVVLIPTLFTLELKPNVAFIPWMLPGAGVILLICLVPLIALYGTKKR